MEETINNRIIWSAASVAGLAFAAITILCGQLQKGIAALELSTFVAGLLYSIVWIAEFAGCIYLMIFLMRKLVRDYEGVTGADTNRYGRRIALFSAIVIATVNYLILYFTPADKLQEMTDTVLATYSSFLDANSQAMMEEMLPNLPAITFFSNLIYCFLYGTILSAILSRFIPSSNPFASENTPSDQSQ